MWLVALCGVCVCVRVCVAGGVQQMAGCEGAARASTDSPQGAGVQTFDQCLLTESSACKVMCWYSCKY